MNDKRVELMEKGEIPTTIKVLALPAITGLVVQSVYNIVDTMFVSWIGPLATGATQIVYPMTMIFSSIGLAFGMGAGSYISRLLGEKNKDRAEKTFSTSFFTAIFIGLLLSIGMVVFLDPIIRLFGATELLMDYCREYGKYISIGGFAMIGNMALNNMLRSEGSAKFSMLGMISGALLNMILDPIFIFVFGWGVAGAAIATTLSQIVTLIILVSFYLKKKTVIPMKFQQFRFDLSIYFEIFKIGMPTFFRQILVSVSMVLLNFAAGAHGSEMAIAAVGIVTRSTMLIFFIIFGLGQGYQPLAGYSYGQKRDDRLLESTVFTVKASLIIACISALIFLVFDNQILSIFKPNEEVLGQAIVFLRWYLLSMILMSISNTIGVYYQAVGNGKKAFLLSISRQGLFFIPLILILPNIYGMGGVYVSQAIADVVTLAVSIILFLPDYMGLQKQVKENLKNKILI